MPIGEDLINSSFRLTLKENPAEQEIDYVEKLNDRIFAFQFKWNEKRKAKFSKPFTSNYNPETMVVNRQNFREFIMLMR